MNYKEKHCTTTAHCCAALTGDFVFKNNVQQAMVAFWHFVPWKSMLGEKMILTTK